MGCNTHLEPRQQLQIKSSLFSDLKHLNYIWQCMRMDLFSKFSVAIIIIQNFDKFLLQFD